MKINLLTCTKDRPQALELCHLFVQRSTRRPDRWLLVDDGASPANPQPVDSVEVCVARRPVRQHEPAHTLPLNLLYSSPMWANYTDELLVFWEDDDWYAPSYLAEVEAAFEANPNLMLYGQQFAPYYRLQAKQWAYMPNAKHSSLCATAMRITPSMRVVFELAAADINSPFVDIRMWQALNPANVQLTNHRRVVGIKQMPGTPSTTYGWKGGDLFNDDVDGLMLKHWIGDDAALYKELAQ